MTCIYNAGYDDALGVIRSGRRQPTYYTEFGKDVGDYE